jgi:hypothetical protein
MLAQRDIALPTGAADAGNGRERLNDGEREQILDLAGQLAEPELSVDVRLSLVECLRRILNHRPPAEYENTPTPIEKRRRPRAPPPDSRCRNRLPFPLGQTEYTSELMLCQDLYQSLPVFTPRIGTLMWTLRTTSIQNQRRGPSGMFPRQPWKRDEKGSLMRQVPVSNESYAKHGSPESRR